MRGFLLLSTSYLTQMLSLLCVCLIVVPLLFPLLATLCGITIATTFFSSYLSKKLRAKSPAYSHRNELLEKTERGNQRAKRLSLSALGISFFLYGILRIHTSVCYVNSLDRELDPTREQFRKMLRPETEDSSEKKEKEP